MNCRAKIVCIVDKVAGIVSVPLEPTPGHNHDTGKEFYESWSRPGLEQAREIGEMAVCGMTCAGICEALGTKTKHSIIQHVIADERGKIEKELGDNARRQAEEEYKYHLVQSWCRSFSLTKEQIEILSLHTTELEKHIFQIAAQKDPSNRRDIEGVYQRQWDTYGAWLMAHGMSDVDAISQIFILNFGKPLMDDHLRECIRRMVYSRDMELRGASVNEPHVPSGAEVIELLE